MAECPLTEYHALVGRYPERFSLEIKQMISLQKDMLKKYDFLADKGAAVVRWIENACILPEGESAGKKVKLMLWQKWLLYSIFCFWGYFEEPVFDGEGSVAGLTKKYLRVVNDILLVIASGNAKTTFMGFLNTYLLYSREYPAAKLYIGSNAQNQSRLCYDMTHEIIAKNKTLKHYARLVPSMNLIEIKKNNSSLLAMSSDGKNFEGIIPTNVIIDEIHEMKTGVYAHNLRKSVKRDDGFVFETTTMGTVRGGYLDERLNYSRQVLNGEIMNERFLCAIYKQDSAEEVINAYKSGDMQVYIKSNPGLGCSVSVTMLRGKVRDAIEDPAMAVINLTKNFNVPQNPITCYFSAGECRAKAFDESVFYQAPVFFGLDMATTRAPEDDLACLTMLTVNPITGNEYYKDFYFLPKYWSRVTVADGGPVVDEADMVKAKSKVDAGIEYDAKAGRYGYQVLADKGHIIVINEELTELLGRVCNDKNLCDMSGVTQKFVLYFMAYLESVYGFADNGVNARICKIGLDPNFAAEIESVLNTNIRPLDNLPIVVKFLMQRREFSYPMLKATKEARARGLVYCNNRLTEQHFYNAEVKNRSDDTVMLVNSLNKRKDGVIAHLAARTAYHIFTTNKYTGAVNRAWLENWWRERDGIMAASTV